MKDCSMAADNLTVCGEIVYIQEKISQKGKPYYSITLTDTTDKLFLSYFPKKKTEEKIKQLKQGDFIVWHGRERTVQRPPSLYGALYQLRQDARSFQCPKSGRASPRPRGIS